MTGPLAGLHVLVAEDEALVAMLLEDAIQDAGGQVVGPAMTLEEALALVREAAVIDVATLDLNLGGRNSMAVAQALAARGVPFLVVSGYGAAPAGVVAPVLNKPFGGDELVRALVGILARGPAPLEPN